MKTRWICAIVLVFLFALPCIHRFFVGSLARQIVGSWETFDTHEADRTVHTVVTFGADGVWASVHNVVHLPEGTRSTVKSSGTYTVDDRTVHVTDAEGWPGSYDNVTLHDDVLELTVRGKSAAYHRAAATPSGV